MTTPISQLAKIQIRNGVDADLPGSPTNLNPLTFPAGLDVAEMALTGDKGRLFIGVSNPVSPALNRITFPYQNVEIMTETSPALTSRIENSKSISKSTAYNTAVLAPSASFTNLLYSLPESSSISPYLFENTVINAKFEYHMMNGTAPYAAGSVILMCDTGATSGYVFHTMTLFADLVNSTSTAATITWSISGTSGNYNLKYKHSLGFSPLMYFKMNDPTS